jgi:hypothetical protein
MIEYQFDIEGGGTFQFQVDVQRQYTQEIDRADHPFWTELEYHQCDNCPLAKGCWKHCPVAVDLRHVFAAFSPLASFRKVAVSVRTPEREYRHYCDLQIGLNSLMGLIMATSACPILAELRPLARFHLPFATREETIFRTVGAYLVKQYFVMKDGGKPDFELRGLSQLYEDLVVVNTCFVERIRAASAKDANLNAIIRYDTFSLLILVALKRELTNERLKFFCGFDTAPSNSPPGGGKQRT